MESFTRLVMLKINDFKTTFRHLLTKLLQHTIYSDAFEEHQLKLVENAMIQLSASLICSSDTTTGRGVLVAKLLLGAIQGPGCPV